MKTVALALMSMLIVVVLLPIDAQRLVPKNEVARAPGFEAFLVHLREAVERRDADFIAALVPETMRAGWDDEGGPAAFRRRYKLADRPAARGRAERRDSLVSRRESSGLARRERESGRGLDLRGAIGRSRGMGSRRRVVRRMWYRMAFVQENGRWRFSYYIGGD